ncbi:unnamed protein product [Schistosoma margrebowiei]|uniref:Uncharacterized protein n=1 Tax=Schistosoma margrebowiei TaxID=48269 RepID=A0A183N2S9_9TREM|nr:unnamed protein product [Schistosoma margrebowiei]
MQLDSSEFVDDLAFQYRTHQQMHIKTASVAAASEAVDLNIHKGKLMILKCNTENTNPITVDAETSGDVVFHVYGTSGQCGSQIATEMSRHNLAVLGIRETHWTQAGQKKLATGEMLLYSRHEKENAPHSRSCSNAVQSSTKCTCRMGISLIQNRQSIIQKKEEGITMNIIQCYAPTNDSNDGIKDQFYEQLQSITEKKKKLLWRTTGKETLDRIKESKNKKTAINNSRTRAESVQAQAEYKEADKQKYVEELATTAEKATKEGNMKKLYDKPKKLAGKYSKLKRSVKDKEGRRITEIQQQRNRWVEYFGELLNGPTPMNPPYIEAAHTDLPIYVTPPTTEEIRITTRQIKREKTA